MGAGLKMFEHYRERVRGTTIDSSTLLSTDYFNLFNEVIMLLGMLPDMPDMLDEVVAWQYKTYSQHFAESGLAFAPLAIEAYPHAPPALLMSFEQNTEKMRSTVEEAKRVLGDELAAGDADLFAAKTRVIAFHVMNKVMQLRDNLDAGEPAAGNDEGQ